jgi:hypothetical protein
MSKGCVSPFLSWRAKPALDRIVPRDDDLPIIAGIATSLALLAMTASDAAILS